LQLSRRSPFNVKKQEHFVYVPKQSTANAQDIPFFLSTRLETSNADDRSKSKKKGQSSEVEPEIPGDPVHVLSKYEKRASELAQEYEDDMVRF
jgi:hypothetical protein